MITLINDDFNFSNLLKGDYRKTYVKTPSFMSEYKADAYKKEFDSCLGEMNLICDTSILDYAKKNYKNASCVIQDLQNIEIKNDFNGFNVAVYRGFTIDLFLHFLKKTKAKLINYETQEFENGFRFLDFDKQVAYKKAAKIVLDAYDSGADFLVVGDSLSFKMFDTLSGELQKVSNRDFSDFYILHMAEFIALANGNIPASLKEHKLKVSLV
ncbi:MULTISPECIES: HdrB C-terminal domain-containing protein [unclassified Campylobacter]|uniref:HdrB C-terminal domain-containing protein n=1 Tax=unclassified Campylobacter TaxID=2593542 RepID=UPI001D2E7506|nr:hypothetical protein [Campylobacter sp. RM9331]MBZ8004903.1 hypothetical protein [Campylobacter sp. RM9332]